MEVEKYETKPNVRAMKGLEKLILQKILLDVTDYNYNIDWMNSGKCELVFKKGPRLTITNTSIVIGCRWDGSEISNDDIEHISEIVYHIMKDKGERVSSVILKEQLDNMIREQIDHFNKLKSIFVYSENDKIDEIIPDYTSYTLPRKVKYLSELQDKCRTLLSAHQEYKPGSEKVLSLGEEFDKLKTISKLE